MAHVLIIEGWLSDSGNLILKKLKEMGHTFTFVTRNPKLYQSPDFKDGHPLLTTSEKTIVTETNDIHGLIESVREIAFDAVLTACDYYFEAVRAVADAYGLPCPFPEALKDVKLKHLMRQKLEAAGVANAAFKVAYHWDSVLEGAAEIGYPLIIKPVDLGSSTFVRLIQNENELYKAYCAINTFSVNYREQRRNPAILLEEVLIGEEVSVETVTVEGKTQVVGITDKSVTVAPYFVETGHMHPAKLSELEIKQLCSYVTEVLESLGFNHGVSHTEVKLTSKGPIVVEVNPRVPGNYIVELVEAVTGIHLIEIFIRLALGDTVELNPVDTGVKSAAVLFVLPVKEGIVKAVEVDCQVKEHPLVSRLFIPELSNKMVKVPVDNSSYLGHVVVMDKEGMDARSIAESVLEKIQLTYV